MRQHIFKKIIPSILVGALLAACSGGVNPAAPQAADAPQSAGASARTPRAFKSAIAADVAPKTFTASTVVAKTSAYATSLIVVAKSRPYFFLMKSTVTYAKPYLLVRSYNSLFVLRTADITQIRFLDQPTTTFTPASTFASESNAKLLNNLSNTTTTGASPLCPDCAFAPSADFVNASPWGAESEAFPDPAEVDVTDCSIENCTPPSLTIGGLPNPPIQQQQPQVASTGACFPRTWNYSQLLQECVAPGIDPAAPVFPTPDFTYGIGVQYFWAFEQISTALLMNIPINNWGVVDAFTHYLDIDGVNLTFTNNMAFPPGPAGEGIIPIFTPVSYMNVSFIQIGSMRQYAYARGIGAIPVPTLP